MRLYHTGPWCAVFYSCIRHVFILILIRVHWNVYSLFGNELQSVVWPLGGSSTPGLTGGRHSLVIRVADVTFVFTSSVPSHGFQFLLDGRLSLYWRCGGFSVACVLLAVPEAGQWVTQGPSEHGAGEDIYNGVHRGVQKVQAQRCDVDLGEGVERLAVPRTERADGPHADGCQRGGEEAQQEHCNNGNAHVHCLSHLLRVSQLPSSQELIDPDGAVEQHSQRDEELQHGEDPVHAHQDDDGVWSFFVRGEEETLRGVAADLDVVVSEHGNPRTDDQHPDEQWHKCGLMLGHTIEPVVRVDHLKRHERSLNAI